ncbi:L,D-transpeptidase family protein [Granulosicoccus antarcticus]|uniref:L,D-TPase catalytic domain-containing protein n=1 Tax=Granulosicoccus antarcticus IMCC3135 TaxID=1192854 RepID=A0A2Z2NXW6_9GAMM|nr:L,D-transpeptidase family protein [Granulosicoccus antarcticus]ASJ75325.1 hypothetical protein IMCC3135_26350 [Granulosicoccus antarcticus IMCC3135]
MKLIILLCMTVFMHALWAAPHQPPNSSQALDRQLAATLQSLSAGDMAQARVLARQAARTFPNSELAQLLAAELTAVSAHQRVRAAKTEQISPALKGLLQEARVRLLNQSNSMDSPIEQQLPSEIIQLGKDVSTLVVADLASFSLYHISVDQGLPTLMRQHYIGGGKAGFGKRLEGDNKTPLGLYNIDGQRSDASLPDLYGAGALTLDYPNALDRLLGRTGSGIWLHGVPHNQRNRAPLSSEGCVTMSNDHFITLRQRLSLEQNPTTSSSVPMPSGRPMVFLTHDTRWVDAQQQREEQLRFQALFTRYKQAWAQQSLAELLSLYETPEPALDRLDRLDQNDQDDNALVTQLNAVESGDISIVRNPSISSDDSGEPQQEFVIMRLQTGSSNENQLSIYWAKSDDGKWRVVTEQWNIVNS